MDEFLKDALSLLTLFSFFGSLVETAIKDNAYFDWATKLCEKLVTCLAAGGTGELHKETEGAEPSRARTCHRMPNQMEDQAAHD
ncbi:hypothetical protein DPEC_G00243540 [Dallia pectoralis]|uniref:Uncharacterized protein n=1 Tax=Dallia pectoralis TaxID=75939 RepID=A0ACC2FVC1_DALPE|nr:hypothetical protein DPEC_G00243540 [Dallia pectoralis]